MLLTDARHDLLRIRVLSNAGGDVKPETNLWSIEHSQGYGLHGDVVFL